MLLFPFFLVSINAYILLTLPGLCILNSKIYFFLSHVVNSQLSLSLSLSHSLTHLEISLLFCFSPQLLRCLMPNTYGVASLRSSFSKNASRLWLDIEEWRVFSCIYCVLFPNALDCKPAAKLQCCNNVNIYMLPWYSEK